MKNNYYSTFCFTLYFNIKSVVNLYSTFLIFRSKFTKQCVMKTAQNLEGSWKTALVYRK